MNIISITPLDSHISLTSRKHIDLCSLAGSSLCSRPYSRAFEVITHEVITYAGCIAAGVGRAFSRVCMSVCLFVFVCLSAL